MFLHSSRPARLAGGALLPVLFAGVLAGCGETRGAGEMYSSAGVGVSSRWSSEF